MIKVTGLRTLMLMNLEILKSRIEKMQAELNYLTGMGQDISSQRILQLSIQLDDLIVQYLKNAS